MNKNRAIKRFKSIFIVFIFVFLIIGLTSFTTKATTVSSDYASYTEVGILAENILDNNIIHKKVTASSTTNSCSNPSGYSTVDSPQQVNMLTVPSSSDIRVVNYTFPSTNGWQRKTLTQFVESFEADNPGWQVIAGVNGDFFDINANNKALPYQTSGTTLSDGDLLRAVERKSVGYTNNGTTSTFIMTDKVTFTEKHQLEIFDDSGNLIAKYDIDKFNEMPIDNEISVYYTYYVNVDDDGDGASDRAELITNTVPVTNSYVFQRPIRCLPQSSSTLFAKGKISYTNQETILQFGQFAIVTSNKEVQTNLDSSASVRVQKDVTGDLAECDQIIGVGSTLMENGEISTNNSDGMRTQRHPRTCIGVKEDGTMMFFVVDGRQQESNMYGMTQDELGVMMKYYGCYSGVNIDGGGSSTFGIRDENGEFIITNSPSDGKLRNNSNALLIVVPTIKLSTSYLTEESINLSYVLDEGMSISNLNILLNGQTIEMTSQEMIVNNLIPETNYVLTYSYDITYRGITRRKTSNLISFTTGKKSPLIEKATFDLNDNVIDLNFKILDEKNLHSFISIEYNRGVIFIDDISLTNQTLQLSSINSFEIELIVDYNVASTPNRNSQKIVQFNWYPNSLNLENYLEAEQTQIKNIINQVNENLVTLTKEEVITKIIEAKAQISLVKVKEVVLEELRILRESKINELNNLISKNEYSKKNKDKIDNILSNAINAINASTDAEEINSLFNNAQSSIKEVRTKNCNSNSIVITSLSIVSLTILFVLLKKKY